MKNRADGKSEIRVDAESELEYQEKYTVTEMVPAILQVVQVCADEGINIWLNYGALLGMIRENRLLPWNNDAELTCWHARGISKRFINVCRALNDLGYHAAYYSGTGSLAVKKAGVVVNVSCYWKLNDFAVRPHETAAEPGYSSFLARYMYLLALMSTTYCQLTIAKGGFYTVRESVKQAVNKVIRFFPMPIRRSVFLALLNWSAKLGAKYEQTAIPSEYFEDFRSIDFYGHPIPVPRESDGLLAYIYGENWRVPKVDWSFYNESNKQDSGIRYLHEPFDYQKLELV